MSSISVMIVDDSALMRNLISKIIENASGLQVAGRAMNGRFALDKLHRLNPDVIVLDLEMPDINGIQFLEERRKRKIEIPVIILSSFAQRGARITMDALALGASDFILKPTGPGSPDMSTIATQLAEMARSYGGHYRKTHKGDEPENQTPPPTGSQSGAELDPADPTTAPAATGASAMPAQKASVMAEQPPARSPVDQRSTSSEVSRIRPIDPTGDRITPEREPGAPAIVAIGVSTGGPNALRQLLPGLPKSFPLPVLVVQHMPAGFTTEFARSLAQICSLEVREARDGDLVQRGRVLIAPGDRHMEIEERRLGTVVRITEAPPVNGHRPSVDVLFRTVAQVYRHQALALLMTGMGRDGAEQLGEIYRRGGMTLAQDRETSVVYGMPKVATDRGVVRRQVALREVASVLVELAADSAETE